MAEEDRAGHDATQEAGAHAPRSAEPTRHAGEQRHLRSFGRQSGHTLSPSRQRLVETLLPTLRLDLAQATPAHLARSLFSPPIREVWLEIGFGGGEHLLAQARANPKIGFIGCEPFRNGIAKVLSEIDRGGDKNILLWDDDARDVVEWIATGQLSQCFILFPDPWPKRRHAKRRLVSPAFVKELARSMAPEGRLRFATDIADYQRTGLAAILGSGHFDWTARSAADWRARPDDWPQTRYERKAIAAGRRCAFFEFRRRSTRVSS
ncbi:MAG: tRNA (guanosine(46)-N7)-methyltransferase TrmB [Pseudomonadota bacterium]